MRPKKPWRWFEGVLVERLVELADQLLEDRAHRGVVDPLRMQVDVLEALHHLEQQAGLVELADGVVEVEALEHLAHVLAETGEVVAEVRSEKAEEHRAQYSEIVDKAQAVTLAKLDDASAAQANLIACQATDKVRLADNMPTSIKSDSTSTQSVLDFLEQISDSYREKQARVVSTQDPDKDEE